MLCGATHPRDILETVSLLFSSKSISLLKRAREFPSSREEFECVYCLECGMGGRINSIRSNIIRGREEEEHNCTNGSEFEMSF